MSLELFNEGDCIAHATKPCACIEFTMSDQHRHGFHASQLIHYALEPNAEAESENSGRPQAPPQKLTLAFATADVILTGWRLSKICDDLRDGRSSPCAPSPNATPTWIATSPLLSASPCVQSSRQSKASV